MQIIRLNKESWLSIGADTQLVCVYDEHVTMAVFFSLLTLEEMLVGHVINDLHFSR